MNDLFERAKAVPLADVLGRLNIKFDKGYKFLCPAHDDHNPSADFRDSDSETGKAHSRWKCFACGAGGSGVDLVIHAKGMEKADAARWVLGESPHASNGHTTNGKPASKPSEPAKGKSPKVYRTEGEVLDVLLRAVRSDKGENWNATGEWFPYRNQAGDVVLGVVRFEDGKGEKTFRQFSRKGDGWIAKGPSSGIPPFHLPELDKATPLVVVEGEKACAAAWGIGLQSTTWAGGSGAVRKTDWSLLSGFDVVIWPDADEPGRKAAADVAKALHGVAARVRILPDDPDAAKGDDAADALAVMGQEKALKHFHDRLELATEWTPGESPALENDGPKATYEGRDYHDPKTVAEAFIREQNSRIAYAAGVPYEFRDGVYRQVMPDDLRAMVYGFANEWFARHHEFEQGEGKGKQGHKPIKPVTRKVMADLMEALAGCATNLGVVTFPSWAGEPPKGWTSANTVNCANGLLNIDTLDFMDHTPKFMSLAKSKAAWDGENAECPGFDRWLTQVLPGNDTEAENSRENLLAFMGYLLVPDRSIHKALSIIGQKRTGKGTALRLIRKLVGEGNVATTSLTEISSRFGLEPLLGKLVAMINDARPGKSNSDLSDGAERLLQITGGDAVSVDRKGRSALPSVDLPVRFVMASNGHLNMPDPNAVLPSRQIVIYFNTSFYGHENSAIEADMERELPGILAKCVDAYREMRKREGGFHELESTREAQEISERLAQPLVEFMGDVFKIGDSATWLSARDVYHAYVGWFTENCPGNKPMTFTRFRTEFGSCKSDVTVRRPRKGNDSREWFVFGVSLRDGESFAALKRIGLGYVAKHAGFGTSGEPAT